MCSEVYSQVGCQPNVRDRADTLRARHIVVTELAVCSTGVNFQALQLAIKHAWLKHEIVVDPLQRCHGVTIEQVTALGATETKPPALVLDDRKRCSALPVLLNPGLSSLQSNPLKVDYGC